MNEPRGRSLVARFFCEGFMAGARLLRGPGRGFSRGGAHLLQEVAHLLRGRRGFCGGRVTFLQGDWAQPRISEICSPGFARLGATMWLVKNVPIDFE